MPRVENVSKMYQRIILRIKIFKSIFPQFLNNLLVSWDPMRK